MEVENVSWQQVDEFVDAVVRHYGESDIDSVWGPARGGLPLAVCVSHALNVPLVDEPGEYTLIVDDIADTGETLKPYDDNGHIIATMYYHEQGCFEPDLWCWEKSDSWVVFPWENAHERGRESHVLR